MAPPLIRLGRHGETVIRGKSHTIRRALVRWANQLKEVRRRVLHAWSILTTGDC